MSIINWTKVDGKCQSGVVENETFWLFFNTLWMVVNLIYGCHFILREWFGFAICPSSQKIITHYSMQIGRNPFCGQITSFGHVSELQNKTMRRPSFSDRITLFFCLPVCVPRQPPLNHRLRAR